MFLPREIKHLVEETTGLTCGEMGPLTWKGVKLSSSRSQNNGVAVG